MKIGLALSGGGVKSISQLPIIQALEKENIEISMVSGTSMGSVIAALFACGIDSEQLVEIVLRLELKFKSERIFSKPSSKLLPFSKEKLTAGYVDGGELERAFQEELDRLGIYKIKDVKIPLAIPAVDLVTGHVVCFVSHPDLFKQLDPTWEIVTDITLAKAVRASCSFPFVIAAMEFKDYVLVDGGVRMNLPIDLVSAYGADKSIAVTMHTDARFDEFDSWMGVANRVMDLMRIEEDEHLVKKATVHINVPLSDVWVFELGKGTYTMDKARDIVEEHHQEFEALIQKPSFWDRLKKELGGQ